MGNSQSNIIKHDGSDLLKCRDCENKLKEIGIKKNNNPEENKKNYRQWSLKNHPDKYKGPFKDKNEEEYKIKQSCYDMVIKNNDCENYNQETDLVNERRKRERERETERENEIRKRERELFPHGPYGPSPREEIDKLMKKIYKTSNQSESYSDNLKKERRKVYLENLIKKGIDSWYNNYVEKKYSYINKDYIYIKQAKNIAYNEALKITNKFIKRYSEILKYFEGKIDLDEKNKKNMYTMIEQNISYNLYVIEKKVSEYIDSDDDL